MDKNKLIIEQKAHDLAVAYAVYLANTRAEKTDVEPFYEDYTNSYQPFLIFNLTFLFFLSVSSP